jgi:hypothetical protein
VIKHLRYLLFVPLAFLLVGTTTTNMLQVVAKLKAASDLYVADLLTDDADHIWSSAAALRDAYNGNLILVRRSTPDTTTQAIGQNANGTLDETALLAFCGSGNGTVVTIYDQVGAWDLTAPATTNEPRIVLAGVVDKDADGKPSMVFDGTTDVLLLANGFDAWPVSAVGFMQTATAAGQAVYGFGNSGSTTTYYTLSVDSTEVPRLTARNTSHREILGATDVVDSTRRMLTGLWKGDGDRQLYQGVTSEGTQSSAASFSATNKQTGIGRRPGQNSNYFNGYISGVLAWNTTILIGDITILRDNWE